MMVMPPCLLTTQYLTITKCTLLRLDSCNFIKLSETYLKKTDRDVVYFFLYFFHFTILRVYYHLPISKSAALYLSHNDLKECWVQFPSICQKGTIFSRIKTRDLYISITYVGWDLNEAATKNDIFWMDFPGKKSGPVENLRCGGPFDPDLPGHHCLDLGTVDKSPRRNHAKRTAWVGRKWLYLNVYLKYE